jgi:hypothetical protein
MPVIRSSVWVGGSSEWKRLSNLRLTLFQEGFDICVWDAVGGIAAGWVEFVGVGELSLFDPEGDQLM